MNVIKNESKLVDESDGRTPMRRNENDNVNGDEKVITVIPRRIKPEPLSG
jgi:hypothetical protein